MKKIYLILLSTLMALSITGCEPDTSSNVSDITIEAWGPKSIVLDQPRKQKDGSMGVWFKLSEAVQPDSIEVWIGDQKVSKVRVSEQKGSFAVEGRLLDKSGKLPMHLVHIPSGKQIPLGDFVVFPSAKEAPVIQITAWGPQSTLAGKGVNVQKNGLSAIWFKMSGIVIPNTMEAWFDKQKLDKFSISSDKGGTMLFPQELLSEKGNHPVYLVHKPSSKRYVIGFLVVK